MNVMCQVLMRTLARARSSVSFVSVHVTPKLIRQLMPLMQDLIPAPSVNESDSVIGNIVERETVLQSDDRILQLYETVDGDQSASEDEEELSEERAIDKRYVVNGVASSDNLSSHCWQRVRVDQIRGVHAQPRWC